MAVIDKALIVGGGIGGMSAALVLRRLGIEVELVDLDPQWRVSGAGITITGPTLRAFKQLGIFEAVASQGYTGEGITVCDREGHELALLPTPMSPEDGVPGTGGIMRPVLHSILSDAVRASGTRVRLGVSIQDLKPLTEPDPDALEVRFTDASVDRYGLIVGADGLFSKTRTLLFPQAPAPQYTGQCVWRVVLPRPAQIDRRHFFLGGPCKVGLSPVSAQEMYLFLLERSEHKRWVPEGELVTELRTLLQPYGGILNDVRASLNETSRIVLRPLEAFLLPAPWHTERVLLIGDAAHPTTPQLASGAGMAVEDALVLGQELKAAASVPAALAAFMRRRYERCQLVVRNSLEIGRREQADAPVSAQTELVEQSLRVLAAPI